MTIDPSAHWQYPGARWWKFDFHTHTPASHDYGRRDPHQATLQKIKPRDWLLNFMRAGIDCVAVTDHHSGAWIDRLKDALADLQTETPKDKDFRQLYLFPGVEISSDNRVHVLAILDPKNSTDDISKLLGSVDYNDGEDKANEPTIFVIKKIISKGYIPILAHVTSKKGIFERIDGSFVHDEANSNHLFEVEGPIAIEVNREKYTKPPIYNEKGLSWPEVSGSDSHNVSRLNPNERHTWIKMEEPSLEGLRVALIDGQQGSVRRSNDPVPYNSFQPLPEHFIKEIEIKNAQYMGRPKSLKLPLNPWFNAIIGGRGTGKSTIIHGLRIVSNRIDELEDLNKSREVFKTFQRFNQVPESRYSDGGLTDETEINWTVNRDGICYCIKFQQNNSTKTREVYEFDEKKEDWRKSSIKTLDTNRFPLRILSQGQIAELAENAPQALLKVIDDAVVQSISSATANKEKAVNRFYTLRTRLRELEPTLEQEHTIDLELQDIEHKLARFEQLKHARKLKRYRTRKRQSREIDLQFKSIDDKLFQIQKRLAQLSTDEVPPDLFDEEATEDRYILSVLKDLTSHVDTTRTNIENTIEQLKTYIEQALVKTKDSDWNDSLNQAIQEHERLQPELQRQGLDDPKIYATLLQDRQRLLTENDELFSLRQERDKIADSLQDQVKEIQEQRRIIANSRQDFLHKMLHDNKYVRIYLKPYGTDKQAIEQSLRRVLNITDGRFASDILQTVEDKMQRGIIAELLKYYPTSIDHIEDLYVKNTSLELESKLTSYKETIQLMKERLERGCLGKGDFSKWFNEYLKRSYDDQPAFLDQILTWFPEDGLSIKYSQTGNGKDFRPIIQASAGQKAAAVLAFLLTHGKEPLVLDQPEDDLDNALISDLLVHQIRENKLRRQIIIVTHNPNIVVNGDAEMLHVLEFLNGQCQVNKSGSLQKLGIQEEVCNVMEGGHDALKLRYRKLGMI